MRNELAPPGVAPPAANYALAIQSVGVTDLVHTSGIVPTRPDGTVPDDIGEQAEVVWAAIAALLADAGMNEHDIVSITTYVVVDHLADLGVVMAARDHALGGRRAASTLVTVPALAQPAWKMEVAVIAAR